MTAGITKRELERRIKKYSSLVDLAESFGVQTTFYRRYGSYGRSTPTWFRELVRSKVGTAGLNKIRRTAYINRHAEGSTTGW